MYVHVVPSIVYDCHVLNCVGNANVCGLYNVAIFTFLSVERCGPENLV